MLIKEQFAALILFCCISMIMKSESWLMRSSKEKSDLAKGSWTKHDIDCKLVGGQMAQGSPMGRNFRNVHSFTSFLRCRPRFKIKYVGCCRNRQKFPELQGSGVPRKKFWGVKVMASLVGGPGLSPPDAGKFSKIFKKIFLWKLKNALF